MEVRHHIGVERIMFATDFPHVECEYPRTQELLADIYAGVPESERYQIMRGNAIRFFKLKDKEKADRQAGLSC